MVGSVGVSGLLPSLSGLGGQKPPSFNQIDADHDGTVSLEEFKAAAKYLPAPAPSAEPAPADELFARIDTDGNGLISKDEATSFRSKFSAQVQAMMLQIQEQRGSAGEMTAAVDTDGDGSISKDETLAFLERVQGRHHHRHGWLGRLASQSYADASTVATTEIDTAATTKDSRSV